ncbi:beta-propeller domain-containing protein [Salinibacillus xinjiangensis]|uniref:SbsA Ig-like domain-containing protein n=1 Tax=Salinibacillus xinjiangensis TaxID=1229268 RepID=A0A6G1X553_9BACI|nr:beta-propeller domain-containing protein [Salinibacillus xinjiangensis]MRG86094.1 hypothetical protein [Salinibacillus xinjiangensis]
MKKILWLCVIVILGIGVLTYSLLSNSITAQIPAASSYAPAFKDWSIHFSEPMNPETFTNDSVQVFDQRNDTIEVDFDWNEDNTILTVKAPENGYQLDESYRINISERVETTKGDQLSQEFTHVFQAVEDLPKIAGESQLLTLLEERMEKRRQQYDGVVMENAEADTATEESSASGEAGNNAPTSDTNVQVDGIDEGDTIKTDGDYIYFARENDIVIAAAKGKNSTVVSKIDEDHFHTQELYLHKNLLISIGITEKSIRPEKAPNRSLPNADTAIYPPVHAPQTTAYIYDISDKKNPKRVREFTMEGALMASRKMDGFLYLVGNNHPPYHIMSDKQGNKDVEVRPFIKDTAVSEQGEPVDYEDMYFFPESHDERFMLLTSLDLSDMEKEANVETYLGASNQMYMSKNHIYTAVNKYPVSTNNNQNSTAEIAIARPADTKIIQFKIDQEDITYHASTIVKGTLINQFAMDERNETFRVATTKGLAWQEEQPSTNNLYTFDLDLKPLGKVEGLAEGERIYSVRFMDHVAYMVTFKQVDPLFVIDLQDAKNPKVLGKLKIPGFSNYLHPLDDHHVIGFGQHTELRDVEWDDEPQVQQAGLKISVFDVSDPTKPKEKYSEILGQRGSHSEINYNHKSLYKHPEKNLFGFPAQLSETKVIHKGDATYEDMSFVYEGAFLYEITPEKGIELKDTITHQKKDIPHPRWESQIKRMVSVGDILYTFSFEHMKVYNIKEENVIKSVELPDLKRPY